MLTDLTSQAIYPLLMIVLVALDHSPFAHGGNATALLPAELSLNPVTVSGHAGSTVVFAHPADQETGVTIPEPAMWVEKRLVGGE